MISVVNYITLLLDQYYNIINIIISSIIHEIVLCTIYSKVMWIHAGL